MKWLDRHKWAGRRSGIYEIRNTASGRFYIGSAQWLARRYRQHKHLLLKGEHPNPIMQNSFNKHGKSAFTFKVLLVCDMDNVLYYEQRLLDEHATSRKCFNIGTVAVASRRGCKMPPEIVARIADKLRGRKQPKEERERRAASMKGNQNRKGKPHSQEQKDLRSRKAAMRGPSTGKYKGVHFSSKRGMWVAQLWEEGTPTYLGSFSTSEQAALAYNLAASEKWEDCYLNEVPENVSLPNKEERRAIKVESSVAAAAMRAPKPGKYKGAYRRSPKKWRATIANRGAKVNLGNFPSPEEAALAYNEAALEIYGEGNCYLNEVVCLSRRVA